MSPTITERCVGTVVGVLMGLMGLGICVTLGLGYLVTWSFKRARQKVKGAIEDFVSIGGSRWGG